MEYGFWSVVPPLVAIVLAIATRRVVLSLSVAILTGAALLARSSLPASETVGSGGWLNGFWHSFWSDHLWPAIADWDHQQVFLFSVILGAMVGVIEAVGGMESLARSLMRRVRTRRGGQLLVWGLGLGVFFDDYANTLLLGSTMRSAADRLRFSRAKLAYLVDSTAAPVAGLAVVSTWVATEISLIEKGLVDAGIDASISPFSLFLATITSRTYAIAALVMVAIIASTGRDFGPMLAAEREAWRAKESASAARDRRASAAQSGAGQEGAVKAGGADQGPDVLRCGWWTAVLPVMVCLGVIAWLLVRSGLEAVQGVEGAGEDARSGSGLIAGLRYWGEVIGSANSYQALLWGSIAGWLTAVGISLLALQRAGGEGNLRRVLWGSLRGAGHIVPAMVILGLAWTLSSMTGGSEEVDGVLVRGPFLDTGGYFQELLSGGRMPAWLLPTAVFLAAGFVALATGTSWGTMALLTPLSISLAVAAGGGIAAEGMAVDGEGGALLIPVVGAVLAGAIFGDHCSPISDTTVLSSRASGCDHVLHVRTQLPYALAVAAVSIVCGTLPAGLGLFPPWVSLLMSSVLLWLLVRLVGQKVDASARVDASAGQPEQT